MEWTEEFLSLFLYFCFSSIEIGPKSHWNSLKSRYFHRMDDTVFLFLLCSPIFCLFSLNSIDCINDYAIIFHFIAFHFSSTFSAHGELDVIDLLAYYYVLIHIHMLPCPIIITWRWIGKRKKPRRRSKTAFFFLVSHWKEMQRHILRIHIQMTFSNFISILAMCIYFHFK